MTAPLRRIARGIAGRLPAPIRDGALRAALRPWAGGSVRAAAGLGRGGKLLVYVSPPADDPAFATIVEGMADLPDYRLAVVGSGRVPHRPNVVAIRRDPTRVPADYFSSADVAVIGSLREPGPVPRLAAVSAGDRLLRDRYEAVPFTVGDPASFASAVKRAVKRRRPAVPVSRPANQWRALGGTAIRLGLGTANYAGQLSAFAWAISRERPDVSIELVVSKPESGYEHPADVVIHWPREDRLDVQLEQARRVLGGYTHVLVDAFRPVLGRLNGDDISADLPALRKANVSVALLGHGSEVRHPKAHRQRHEESGFLDADADLVQKLTDVVERNHRTVAGSGLPVFVTTPDLLADLPTATWTPLVIDVDAWKCNQPIMQRPRPVVVHAPSARWTKGTDRILGLLNDMNDRNLIDFRLIEGVGHDQMRPLIHDADIVIDQLVMGAYCSLACEGMAAGKAVISYVHESTHEVIGEVPPILSATPSTLGSALTRLLDDREHATTLGVDAIRYVREHHDGRRTVRALATFLPA